MPVTQLGAKQENLGAASTLSWSIQLRQRFLTLQLKVEGRHYGFPWEITEGQAGAEGEGSDLDSACNFSAVTLGEAENTSQWEIS